MNKKILLGLGIVFMLVTISFATAANNVEASEKKESPLFKLRTNNANSKELKERVVDFLRNRIYVYFPKIIEIKLSERENVPTWYSEGIGCMTCIGSPGCKGGPWQVANNVESDDAFTQQPGCTYNKGIVCGPTGGSTCRNLKRTTGCCNN